MSETDLHVTSTVNVPVSRVFDLLASPHRHRDFDASGMVVSDEWNEPITKVGQVFRMNMCCIDGDQRIEYQSDNHVTKYKANRKIAWATAAKDGEPFGWFWRYDVSSKGKRDQKTLVTLTYDWGDASPAVRKKYGVPLLGVDDLRHSLELLEKTLLD